MKLKCMRLSVAEEHNPSGSTLRSLGPEEARLALGLAALHVSTVTIDLAAKIMGNRQQAQAVVHRLIVKGWLQRASRGRYVFLPPDWGAEKVEDFDIFVLASASVDVGYVEWWAAASQHGLTTQVPQLIRVATNRQVLPREIQGNPIRYVKLSARKFFGWDDMPSSGRTFRVSSPAKTVADCMDRPDLCGGPSELATIAWRATRMLDEDVLIDTSMKLGSVSACQRLGFLLEMVAPGFLSPSTRSRLRAFIPRNARSVFGRPERAEGDIGYVADWGLLVHYEADHLLSDVPSSAARALR